MDAMMLRISVHIQSNEGKNVSMECELNPHEKSMQFLREVCSIDGIEMVDSNSIYKIVVRVRGRSGRHYEVEASRPMGLFMPIASNDALWPARVHTKVASGPAGIARPGNDAISAPVELKEAKYMARLPDIESEQSKVTTVLRAMSNAKRMRILNELADGRERSVSELEGVIATLSQSTLSQHLARLRRANIVRMRRVSQTIFYSIDDADVLRILRLLSHIYNDDPVMKRTTH